jgi:uncharacterized tellurite resistance protein B-like protein
VLTKIKQFFSVELDLEHKNDPEKSIQLAAAALMIELSRADYQQDPEEQRAIESALKRSFTLEDSQLQELIALAEEENRDATSLYQFTTLIKDNYNADQRYELVKLLWHVALADGEISKYEDHMIRRVADLIYLPHSQFIKAKIAVLGNE